MLSIYAPPGHRMISGREPLGKRYHNDKRRNYGVEKNFPLDEQTDGELFADAMLAASCVHLVERAHAEVNPLSSQTFLPVHEAELGIVPGTGDSLKTRRERAALFRGLTVDGKYSTINASLIELLGDDLVFYRPMRLAELNSYDRTPEAVDPNYLSDDWNSPIRVMQLESDIVRLNVSIRVPCTLLAGSPEPYRVGQVILVNSGRNSRVERVVVEEAGTGFVRATFGKPHSKGEVFTSGRHHRFVSHKRVHHILLRNGKASDPGTLRDINELMRRLVKGVAVWQVMEQGEALECGPFVLDESLLDVTTIGVVGA